jgi:hypothetical protein
MMPEKSNRYKYADLLDKNSGPEAERLMADLEKLFTAPEPPAYLAELQLSSLREGAEKLGLSRIEPARPLQLPAGNGRFFSRPRFSLARALTLSLVAAALVVATVIIVLALNSDASPSPANGNSIATPNKPPTPATGDKMDALIAECKKQALPDYDCLLKMYSTPPVWVTQGRDLNLSQTSNGFTLTIRHVYADANAIFIGYDLKGPSGVRYSLGDISLTDGQGQKLKGGSTGLGYGGAGTASFNPSGLDGDPKDQRIRDGSLKEIKVHFGVSQISIRENPPTPTPDLKPTPPSDSNPQNAVAVASLAGPNTFTIVPVALNFDLTMPFSGGRIIFPAYSDSASNRTVTLQKVVIAPSGTRMLLTNTDSTLLGFRATLTAGSGPALFANGQTYPDQTELSFTENLMDKTSGEWVLTYSEEKQPGIDCSYNNGAKVCQVETPEDAKNNQRYTSGGPWTFRFTIPAANEATSALPTPVPFTPTPTAEVTATSGKCAGYSSLGCAFWTSEFKAIQDKGLGQKVSLSMGINPTLNLDIERVYADANYIVIGYTLSGKASAGLSFIPSGTATLSDEKGNQTAEVGSQLAEAVGGKLGVVVWFKNVGFNADNSKELKLHLEKLRGQLVTPGSQLTPATAKTSTGLQVGPVAFDLTIPVTASRIAALNQEVTVGGVKVKLEQAVLTPVGLKLYLRKYVAKTPGRTEAYLPNWNLNPILLGLNGKDLIGIPSRAQIYNTPPSPQQQDLEGVAEIEFFDPSLFSQQGQWSLLFREALDPKVAGTPVSANSTGPWTFSFTIS